MPSQHQTAGVVRDVGSRSRSDHLGPAGPGMVATERRYKLRSRQTQVTPDLLHAISGQVAPTVADLTPRTIQDPLRGHVVGV
jgi:hypothetical protein